MLQATLALSLVVSLLKSVCCDFSIFSSPIEGDGRLFPPASVDTNIYRYVCEQLPGASQFKSNSHRTWSVIPLAIGDKVIKFWKVKVSGEIYHALLSPSSFCSDAPIACPE